MGDITDSQTEIEFLANKSAQGKLITVTARYPANGSGSVVSYTPASGQTFVLYQASFRNASSVNTGIPLLRLRNNGTSKDIINDLNATSAVPVITQNSIIKGDTLVGDGVKIYDWYLDLNGGTFTNVDVVGTIIGYLL